MRSTFTVIYKRETFLFQILQFEDLGDLVFQTKFLKDASKYKTFTSFRKKKSMDELNLGCEKHFCFDK